MSKKIPPVDLWPFFQNGWEFFNQILIAYYAFQPTLDYEFLCSYLQLWWSYAILSVTTQFISCAQNVHHWPKRTLTFSDIFPKELGIFTPNFTRFLNIHMYARVQIFIQLSPTVTKLYATLSESTKAVAAQAVVSPDKPVNTWIWRNYFCVSPTDGDAGLNALVKVSAVKHDVATWWCFCRGVVTLLKMATPVVAIYCYHFQLVRWNMALRAVLTYSQKCFLWILPECYSYLSSSYNRRIDSRWTEYSPLT